MAIAVAFIALNYRAYDGFFQDDELDTLSWAPSVPMTDFVIALIKPTFDVSNFRPPGHLYFTLMARTFGMDFPPYMTPIFAIHLTNAALLFFLMRKLGIEQWRALAGVALFTLSGTAMDAYWKPMYVFDLLCTLFSLASILLFAHRRWILSFLAFWCAYKSKELAVMLPAVLLAYEYWLGQRRYAILIPFFLASLSFGLQGVLLNPNRNNEYTFRFTLPALKATIPFYGGRFLLLPFCVFIRDRRIWFAVTGAVLFLSILLFLPGRLYQAYAYLPFACAAVALAAAASKFNPVWTWVALILWIPFNVTQLRRQQSAKLLLDDEVYAFVTQVQDWARRHPGITTMVYETVPPGFHHWGVTGAWNIAHGTTGLPALFRKGPEAAQALEKETVVIARPEGHQNKLVFQIHSPTYNQPSR